MSFLNAMRINTHRQTTAESIIQLVANSTSISRGEYKGHD